MAESADILIVGGGVIGCSIAWHLARRRIGRIVLLEKSHLGAGSSGKSGAIIRQHYSNRLTVMMARESLRTFENFDQVVGGPPVFTRTGMVLVVNQNDRAGLDANVAMQRELGVEVEYLSAETLASIDRHAFLADDEIAVLEPRAGYVDAVQVVASFAEAARREGADIRSGVEVRELVVSGSKMNGVQTNEGEYLAKTVVLATGAWASALAENIGIKIPVQACRTQVALLRCPPEFGRPGPVYGDFVNGIYFKPTDGHMIHGGDLRGNEIKDPVNPDDYNEAADGSWLRSVRQSLCRRYPFMHNSYGRGGYGALYGITPDWHPILDRVPNVEGLFIAAGFSGHGFKMSPIVGQLMCELIAEGKANTLDVAALRFSRFDEKDLVQTPYSYGVMG